MLRIGKQYWVGLMGLAVMALCGSRGYCDVVKMGTAGQLEGKVVGLKDGMIQIQSASGVTPFPLTSVTEVIMPPPPEFDQTASLPAAQAIPILEPLVAQWKGVPADWVPAAMARLAKAYLDVGKISEGSILYTQIDTTYPNSSYHSLAVIGKALVAMRSGAAAGALTQIQPLLDQAKSVTLPAPADEENYTQLFIAAGQIAKAQNKPELALEYFMKVKVLLYRYPAGQILADKEIDELRKKYPSVAVD